MPLTETRRSLVKRPRAAVSTTPPAAIECNTLAAPQLTVRDLCRVAVKRRGLILSFAAAVACAAAAYAFLKTPVYEAVTRLHIDPARSTSLGLDADKEKADAVDIDGRIKTEVVILESETVAVQVMNALRLYADPRFAGKDAVREPIRDLDELPPVRRLRLLDRFQKDLRVKTLPGTEIVEIGFRSTDPLLAQNAANSIIDEYMRRTLATRVQSTNAVSDWVVGEMQEISANTAAAQRKLAAFEKKHNLLGADESDNIVTDRLKQLNEELTQAEADRILKEGRYRLANPANAELVASLAPSTTLQVLRTQEASVTATTGNRSEGRDFNNTEET